MVTLLDWIIRPDTNSLQSLSTGETVKLSPRAMEVLGYLIEANGRVVTSSELLDKFWSKSVSSDHAVHNVIADLRSALGDQARNPRYIKTYTKRGYALIAPPVANQISSAANDTNKLIPISWQTRGAKVGLLGAAGLLCLCLVLLLVNSALYSQGPNVVFVSPFKNINVDSTNQHWAEQIPASLISDLSTIENTQIVSGVRNYIVADGSKTAYPNDADYILEGNIQQEDGGLRLQVNLVHALDQSTIFSEHFDLRSKEPFTMHDEIGRHIVSALSTYLDEEQWDEMQSWGTNNPVAYSMFLTAKFHANQSNHRDLETALDNYLSATHADRDFVNAHIGIARTATSLGMYSHEARNIELREIVNNALREVIRIDPKDESIDIVRELALRIEGTNSRFIEATLRDYILSGDAPDFAYSRYASLLAEARLYAESGAFIALIDPTTPFKLSSGDERFSQMLTESPVNLLRMQKETLFDRSAHIAVLNAQIRSAVFEGDRRQALTALERLLEIDEEGAFSMLNQVIISGLWGSSTSAGDQLESANASNPRFDLSHGAKSFIMGDVESGVRYWRTLSTADLRRLALLLYKIEVFFPEEVLIDPAYLALLEELDMGLSWQRHLMEGVREMSSVTGIDLHPQSEAAYESSEFLINNNLWNHAEIQYPNRSSDAGMQGWSE